MMKFPHTFKTELKGDDGFDLHLASLESGNSVTLGTLALAGIMRKPQG